MSKTVHKYREDEIAERWIDVVFDPHRDIDWLVKAVRAARVTSENFQEHTATQELREILGGS